MGELPAKFQHGTAGLTRFPPNVHQLTVTHEGPRTWLTARHNDVRLTFPLYEEDCRHLVALLLGNVEQVTLDDAP